MSVLTCNPIGDIAVDPTSGRLVTTHPRDCTVSILVAALSASSIDSARRHVADHAGNVTTRPAVTPVLHAAG